jgi:hypothetical protein
MGYARCRRPEFGGDFERIEPQETSCRFDLPHGRRRKADQVAGPKNTALKRMSLAVIAPRPLDLNQYLSRHIVETARQFPNSFFGEGKCYERA